MATERDDNVLPFPDSEFNLVSFAEILEWLLGSYYRKEMRERYPSGRWDYVPSAMAMAKMLLAKRTRSKPWDERERAENRLRDSFSDLRKGTGNVPGYLVPSIQEELCLTDEWIDYLEERATAWNAGSPRSSTGVESPRRYWQDTVIAAIEATTRPVRERGRTAGMASQVRHPGLATARNNVQRLSAYYSKLFGGRQSELDALDAFLDDPNPFLLLRAPAGRGKTALLVNWVDSLSQRTDWAVAFVPVSRIHQTSGATSALGLLVAQLSEFYRPNRMHRIVGTLDPAKLKQIAADLLATPPDRAEQLLIVLDGLDEAEGWELGRGFFPPFASHGWKAVVGIREVAEQDIASCIEQWGWPLEQVTRVHLGPPDEALITDVLEQAGYVPTGQGSLRAAVEQVARLAGQDAALVRLYAQDLVEGRITPKELKQRDPGLEEYFRQFRRDVEESAAGSDDVYHLLGLCAAAKGPICVDDCVGLRTVMDGHSGARWLPLSVRRAARSAQRFLLGGGTERDGYAFQLASFQDVYRTRVLATDDENLRFDHAFMEWGEQMWEAQPANFPGYLRHHWVAHLAQGARWERARDLLFSAKNGEQGLLLEWARMRFAHEGSHWGFMEDVELLRNHVQGTGSPVELLHCALVETAIQDLYQWLSPDLLVGLVDIGTSQGKWTFDAALETAMLSDWPSPLLAALAQHALRLAGGRMSVDLEALLAQRWSESTLAKILAALAPLWSETEQTLQVPKAIAAIRAGGGYHKAHLLAAVVPHVPLPQRTAIAGEALKELEARTFRDRGWFADLLSLLPWLSSRKRSDALAFAIEVARSNRCLGMVVPHIPAKQLREAILSEALKRARARTEPYRRALDLADICAGLRGDEARALAREALTQLKSSDEEVGSRQLYFAIPAIVPHVPAEALEAVRAIKSVDERAHCLVRMLPLVNEPYRSDIQKEAETAVYSMGPIHHTHQVDERPALLATLARHSSPATARKMLGDALIRQQRASRSGAERVRALAAILRDLPERDRVDLMRRVCETAETLVRERGEADAVRALVDLVPLCEPERRRALAQVALGATRALPTDNVRRTCLAELYSFTPESERDGILAELRQSIRDRDRWGTWPAECLLRVVRQLPAVAQARLVREALDASLGVGGAALLHRALKLKGKARERVFGYAVAHIESDIEFARVLRTAGEPEDDLTDATDRAVQGVQVLLPHVQVTKRKVLLEAVLAVLDDRKREEVSTTFLPYFGESEQGELAARTLSGVEALSDDELWCTDPLLMVLRRLDKKELHTLLAEYPVHMAFFGVPWGFRERHRADMGATLMALHAMGQDDLCHELWRRWVLGVPWGVDTTHVLDACLLAVWVPLGPQDFTKSVAELIYESMTWRW